MKKSIGTQSCKTIRQKAKTEAKTKKMQKTLANFARVVKFHIPCKNSQGCEFSQPMNFRTTKLPTNLLATLFYFFAIFFYFFPNSPHVIVFSLYNLVICIVLVVYDTQRTDYYPNRAILHPY